MRDAGRHDDGLCAEVRTPWMAPDERLIINTCELVGYPESGIGQAKLYHDYIGQDRRDKGHYVHKSFQWNTSRVPQQLSADCNVEGKGRFTLSLRGEKDFVDIRLSVRNDLPRPMGPINWHFCTSTYESPSLRNPEHDRTYLYDGQRLRSIRELDGVDGFYIYSVAGDQGFRPEIHKTLTSGSIEAQESIMIMEGRDSRHATAIAFEQSCDCFGCRSNMCIHADPYFGTIEPGREKQMRGRLYLIEGDANDVFNRYLQDFRGK
jgi:hypothetical protein